MMRSGNHHARRVTKGKRRVHFCVRGVGNAVSEKSCKKEVEVSSFVITAWGGITKEQFEQKLREWKQELLLGAKDRGGA